jgi:hypothetical protein
MRCPIEHYYKFKNGANLWQYFEFDLILNDDLQNLISFKKMKVYINPLIGFYQADFLGFKGGEPNLYRVGNVYHSINWI